MSKRWDAIRGSAGFYITMAVCLLAIGISSYYLLFDQKQPEAVEETAVPPQIDTYVSAPAPELTEPEEPAVVETLSPKPVEVPAPQMPEIEIDDTPVIAEAPLQIVNPLDGEVVTAFSVEELLYNATLQDWRTHDGIDISADVGATVLAACAGTVLSVEEDALMGATVVLEHSGGYQTTYANLQPQTNVGVGEAVSAGQIIGTVGTTAAAESAQEPHLHFSVTQDGETVDPSAFLNW